MSIRVLALGAMVGSALVLSGCAAGDEADRPIAATSSVPATPGGPLAPDPGGKVIEIGMLTDGAGNVFEPAEFEARRGDVLRFVLKTGVHNANFVADSNPRGATLPPATPLLQLPGQSYDVKVEMAPGRYYFHCDPHALLGMIGNVTVE